MTGNPRINQFLIFTFILLFGMGFALAVPLLSNSQSTAAHYKNVPASSGPCYIKNRNTSDEFDSSDAFALQKMVDGASPGDVILVAGTCEGVQTRAGLTQTVYISKRLTLEGGHTESDWTLEPLPETYTTTLNAAEGGRVVVISGTANVTLDSLYLTRGLADDGTLGNTGGGIWTNSEMTLTSSIVYSNTAREGGGMYNWGVSPMLNNVTFSSNYAEKHGGATYNMGDSGNSSPTLINITFFNNSTDTEGGAMYNDGSDGGNSSPIMTNVTFYSNSSKNGGAMYNRGTEGNSNPTLTNGTFSDNTAIQSGGAMFNEGYQGISSPKLTNVIFSGNSAVLYGGAMYNYGYDGNSSPELTNVTFSGNLSGNGGAMYNNGKHGGESSPILTNISFSGNKAQIGGAMYNYGDDSSISNPEMRNSVLWNNQDNSGTITIKANIYNDNADITLTHSLAQGTGGSSSWTSDASFVDGGGNIDTNPMFITPVNPSSAPTTSGNLRLQSGSPAINAGKNEFVTVSTDLDGNNRILGCIVDMGAFEIGGNCPFQIFEPLLFR